MKTALDHLSPAKQHEIERIVDILFEELDDALKLATSAEKKRGRVLKVILFGSYARGDYVEDRSSGYFSDIDLLIVVNQARLTEIAEFWYKAEDRFLTNPRIQTEVNLIIHTMDEMNDNLAKGQYFFSDIVKDGIALYEAKGHSFAKSTALDAEETAKLKTEYADTWNKKVAGALEGFEFYLSKNNIKDAAFTLHQAVERFYTGLLLSQTLYSPQTHNIKFLRSLAEDLDPALRNVWPRDTKAARANFELLKRAYVDARYSKHFEITREQLGWLRECVRKLEMLKNI